MRQPSDARVTSRYHDGVPRKKRTKHDGGEGRRLEAREEQIKRGRNSTISRHLASSRYHECVQCREEENFDEA
jgi:hypothetical protein